MSAICAHCNQPVPDVAETCPHCGQHCGYPNVRAADNPSEVAALNIRFEAAKRTADKNGSRAIFDVFLRQLDASEAVLTRPLGEITRLSQSDSELYSTFYKSIEAGMRIPSDPVWDELRSLADTKLFGDQNKREIRFGALSLDGVGLPHYGECHITLNSSMISHRASLFEENSAIFLQRSRYHLPQGCRASWARRGALVAAKLANIIQPTTLPAEFPKLLLAPGVISTEDRFVEIHIWGSLTVRSMRAVKIMKWRSRPRRVEIRALEEKLAKYGVLFEKPR